MAITKLERHSQRSSRDFATERAPISKIARFSCGAYEILLSNDIEDVKAPWYHLLTQCSLTIYQHYLWQKAWLETLGKAAGGKTLFIIGSLAQEPVFLIPLIVVKSKTLTLATWIGGEHANYRFGLFAPTHAATIGTILADALRQLPDHLPYRLDALDLAQQPKSWDGCENPMLAALPHTPSALSGGSVNLEADFNAILDRGNAKRKRKILRTQERSMNALGGYQVIRTENEHENRALYDTFVEQKRPWFAERGIKNKFSDAATHAFFNRLAAYNADMADGEKLFEFDYIFADGKPLAILAGGIMQRQHFGYFTSMTQEEKYAALSPGALNFYKRIESACAQGMRRFDFGVGAERYKTSWCDETHPLVDIFVPLSAKGRLYIASRKLKSTLKRQIKENPTLWTWAKSARRFIIGKKF